MRTRGPCRKPHNEADVRAEWWLREYGRFPSYGALRRMRQYQPTVWRKT